MFQSRKWLSGVGNVRRILQTAGTTKIERVVVQFYVFMYSRNTRNENMFDTGYPLPERGYSSKFLCCPNLENLYLISDPNL